MRKTPNSMPVVKQQLPVATDRKVIHHASVADGYKIRSRFLDRLGISPLNSNRQSKCRRVADCCVSPSSSSDMLGAPRQQQQRRRTTKQELLKKDHGQPDENLGPASYSESSFSPKTRGLFRRLSNSKLQQTKTVSFANAVEVISIPSHHSYSNRIKNSFWTNSAEMKQNYARNVLEFSAEGWDYRQVVEEDQFYVTERGRELFLVHPVHLLLQQQQRERNLRWHSFCAVMSAQKQQHAMQY
ncbi:expressed unknown protein [Seminavis robusta]|uniref:Uncharacterized protein n=1 Tax=Seminavis robusta TaxID=568900 RepID=A0A9N8EA64_9STRA|nr:expressed unknown protein [Seminavis robusta]|eukprot:Sro718_g192190.1 n/a (242) ;mRNA; r:27622-28347